MLEQVLTTLGTGLSPIATSALSLVANTAQALGWLLFVLVVSFLLIKDLNELNRSIVKRIPPKLASDLLDVYKRQEYPRTMRWACLSMRESARRRRRSRYSR